MKDVPVLEEIEPIVLDAAYKLWLERHLAAVRRIVGAFQGFQAPINELISSLVIINQGYKTAEGAWKMMPGYRRYTRRMARQKGLRWDNIK